MKKRNALLIFALLALCAGCRHDDSSPKLKTALADFPEYVPTYAAEISPDSAGKAAAALKSARVLEDACDFQTALNTVDVFLKQNGRKISNRDSLLLMQTKLMALTELQRYNEAVECCFDILRHTPLSSAQQIAFRKKAVHLLRDALRYEESIALSDRMLQDPALSLNDCKAVLANKADCFYRLSLPEQAIAANEEAMKLPGADSAFQARMQLRNASLLFTMKPPQQMRAFAIYHGIIDDSSLDSSVRTQAVLDYTQHLLRNSKLKNKKEIVTECKKLSSSSTISGNDLVKLQNRIFEAAGRDTRLRPEIPIAARRIITHKGTNNDQKIAAFGKWAEYLLLEGKTAEAFAIVERAGNLPELNKKQQAQVLVWEGKLLEWQGKYEPAVTVYQRALKRNHSSLVLKQLLSCMEFYYKKDDAVKMALEHKMYYEAAAVCQRAADYAGAEKIALQALSDEKVPLGIRRSCYRFLLRDTPSCRQAADHYFDMYRHGNRNGGIYFWIEARNAMMNGNYPHALRCLEHAEAMNVKLSSRDRALFVIYKINALCALGDFDKAVESAENSEKYSLPPADHYRIALTRAMLRSSDDYNSIAKAFAAVEQQMPEISKLDNKRKSDAIIKVGRTAVIGGRENAAKVIYSIYERMFIPVPRKSAVIPFHEKPVYGIDSFHAGILGTLDRKYGGSMDFLITDVSTGYRGSGIGSDHGRTAGRSSFSAVCDVNGIHLLFHTADPRAEEVEAKLLDAGSYEIYMSTGINQPYFTFLVDLQSGKITLWQTTYSNKGYRRVALNDDESFRKEHIFTADGYKTYLFLGWKTFYDRIPEDDAPWEFEIIHWGRNGGLTWNGVKSVHGRSTWGLLYFRLTEAQRNMIRKKQIFTARALYEKEKNAGRRYNGILSVWKDPELGDPEFYQRILLPHVAELDRYAARVNPRMSDADIADIYEKAVSGWREIAFDVQDMRRRYLENKLMEESESATQRK